MKKVVIIPYNDYFYITENLKSIYNIANNLNHPYRYKIQELIDDIETKLYDESED